MEELLLKWPNVFINSRKGKSLQVFELTFKAKVSSSYLQWALKCLSLVAHLVMN